MLSKSVAQITRFLSTVPSFFTRQLLTQVLSLLIVFSMLANTTPAAPLMVLASLNQMNRDVRYVFLTSPSLSFLRDFSLTDNAFFAFFFNAKKTQQAIAKIEVSPNRAVIREGEQIALTAVAYDARGNVIQGVPFTWKALDKRGKAPELRLQNGLFEPEYGGIFTVVAETKGMSASASVIVKADAKHKVLKEHEKRDMAQAQGKNLNKRYSEAVAKEMARPRPAPFNYSSRMNIEEAKQLKKLLLPIEKKEPPVKQSPVKKTQPMQRPSGEEGEDEEVELSEEAESAMEFRSWQKGGPKVDEEILKTEIEHLRKKVSREGRFFVVGQIDLITGANITGCAYDVTYSSYPTVELYVDGDMYSGTYLGATYSGSYNPSCSPNNAGFEFAIPTEYQDGQSHSVYAYAWDIDYNGYVQLSNSPAYFQMGGSSGGSGTNSNWNNNNAPTANNPGQQPGNPTNTGTDGAGSGNFGFSAPVLSLAGRGMGVNLSLSYNSLLWHKAGTEMSYDIDKGFPGPGWNIGFGKMMDMGSTSGAMLEDLDGTRHSYDGTVQQGYGGYSTYYGRTNDGSFIDYRAYRSPTGITGGTAYLANGTQITYGAAANGVAYPTFIKDRHGNYMTIAYQNNQGPRITTITDNLNRNVTFNYDGLNRLIAITGPGFNGTNRTFVRISYYQPTFNFTFSGLTTQVRDNNPYQVQAIYYPGTDTGYWFGDANSYSSYGMIAKVSERRGMSCVGCTPTDQGTISAGTMSREMIYNYPMTASNLTDAPKYTQMSEDWFGRDVPTLPTTVYNINNTSSPRTSTITLPNGNQIKQYSKNAPNQFDDGVLEKVETISPTNQILSKSETNWAIGDYNSLRVTEIFSTDEKGQTTKQAFTYDQFYNQVATISEFGYGTNNNHPLLRKKVNTYENGAAYRGVYANVNGMNIWSGGRHIFSLVKTEELFDANNVRLSRNEYYYDQSPLVDTPNVVMYDQNFNTTIPGTTQGPNCVQWGQTWINEYDPPYQGGYWEYYCIEYEQIPNFDPSTLARGNLTETRSFENAAPATPTGMISHQSTYDITGNARTASTDCCELMSFSYSTATQYSQPDSMTKGSPSNPALQNTESALYDFNTGATITATDFNGLKTTVTYDSVMRPIQTTFPYTGATPNQGKSVTEYDDVNLKVTQTVTLANNTIVSQGKSYFNGRGQTFKSEALAGNSWNASQVQYDLMGRKAQASLPYDAAGSPTQWTTYQYDVLSRVTQVTAPDGSISQTIYNDNNKPSSAASNVGNTVRSVDAWGRERWARTDDFGRLVEVVEPDPNGNGSVLAANNMVTSYTYSAKDELIQVNQGVQVRKFAYDSLGRLVRQKLAEQSATIEGQWSDAFVYDNRSNLVQRTDARGVKTNFVYANDPLNRLQSINYDKSTAINPNTIADAATVTIGYKTSGDKSRVETVTTAGISTETNVYDSLSRVEAYNISMFGKSNMTMEYEYDTANRLTEVTYPSAYGTPLAAKVVNPSYDNASRLTQMAVNGQIQMSEIVYNPLSQVTQLKTGAYTNNADIEQYTYDAQTGLLTNQKVIKQNTSQTLLDLSYNYERLFSNGSSAGGKTGQLSQIVNNLDNMRNRSYGFDALGRLKFAAGGLEVSHSQGSPFLWEQNYSYDRYGNRTNVTKTGVTANNQPIPLDGLGAMSYDQNTNRITNANYEYDSAGNQTRGQAPNGTFQRFDYDAAGRLVNVKDDSGNVLESYAYGASRQRLKTSNSSLTTYYAWGGSSVLCEYTETTNNAGTFKFSKSYIYAGSRLLSTQIWDGTAETTDFHHPDRLGTKLVTNNAANTHYEQSTLPFGTSLDAEFVGTPTTNQRFTSYDRSNVASLDYAVNRSYSSGQGRFTTVDPIGMSSASAVNPQSNNLYAYVQNNPIDYTDPTGLICYGYHITNLTIYFKPDGSIDYIESIYLGFVTTYCTNDGNTGGENPGDNGGDSDINRIKKDFYDKYGDIFNECLEEVFGKKDKPEMQNLQNSPTTLGSTQQNLKTITGNTKAKFIAGAANPPDTKYDKKGTGGQVLLSQLFVNNYGLGISLEIEGENGVKNYDVENTILFTYGHELANLLDMRKNPKGKNGKKAGYVYGDESDSEDKDTGQKVEKCMKRKIAEKTKN